MASDPGDKLRELARQALELARLANAAELRATIPGEQAADWRQITVTRVLQRAMHSEAEGQPEGSTMEVLAESVEIKGGPRSRPHTLLAVPASWLS